METRVSAGLNYVTLTCDMLLLSINPTILRYCLQAGEIEALQSLQRVRAKVRPPLRVAESVRGRAKLP